MEQALLGTVLAHPETAQEVSDVRIGDFSTQSHQILWSEIMEHKGSLTIRGLVEFLREKGRLDSLGYEFGSITGEAYIQDILTYRSEPDVRAFADGVISASIKRELSGFGRILAMDAEGDGDAEKIIQEAEERLFEIRRRKINDGITIGEVLEMFDTRVDKWRSGEAKPSFEFSAKRVSEIVDFMEDQDFMVIGGRPGWGKSSYLRYEMFNAAMKGKRVAIFNLENNEIEYARYLVALKTGIDSNILKDPRKMSEGILKIFKKAIVELKDMSDRIKVITIGGPSVAEVAQIGAKLVRDGYEAIGVDYLQLIQNGLSGELENTTLSSVALRAFAMKHHVPVICASQMSRAIEQRGENAEPYSSDLRYAGEQDATIIAFPRVISSDETSLRQFPENLDGNGNLKTVIRSVPLRFYITKYRNGGTGVSGLVKWDKATNNYTLLQ